jgi:hypothetical protein
MKTLAFSNNRHPSPPYLVLLHSSLPPDVAEWQDYVRTMSRALGGTSGMVHAFVATDGGGPDAAQRRELAEVLKQGPGVSLTHVFTTDAFVRGIVTAFHWIAKARAVAHLPKDFREVCIASGVSPEHVLDDLMELQKSFPRVETLMQVEHSMQR